MSNPPSAPATSEKANASADIEIDDWAQARLTSLEQEQRAAALARAGRVWVCVFCLGAAAAIYELAPLPFRWLSAGPVLSLGLLLWVTR